MSKLIYGSTFLKLVNFVMIVPPYSLHIPEGKARGGGGGGEGRGAFEQLFGPTWRGVGILHPQS